MSLTHSEHITPAPRGRHGAHYKIIKDKPGMILYRDVPSMPFADDRYCEKCLKTAWDWEKHCSRCGGELICE